MNEIKLYQGDCLEVLDTLEEDSIDTCITDPPYEIGFMNKDWDSAGISFQKETWEKVYRVLKPGAFLLAFGGTRTSHRIAVAIEDAGFEIRDTIMWLYGQGFPKSYNISKGIDKKAGKEREVIGIKPGHEEFANRKTKGHIDFKDGTDGFDRPWMHDDEARQKYHEATAPATSEAELWEGYGTALKPAFEPIIVAMKPIDETYVNNALTHGVAGMWIDGGRIQKKEGDRTEYGVSGIERKTDNNVYGKQSGVIKFDGTEGRWPANVILDEVSAEMLDEQTGIQKGGFVRNRTDGARPFENNGKDTGYKTVAEISEPDGGASRFFYTAKASKKERNAGLEDLPDKEVSYMNTHGGDAERGETWNPIDERTGKERDRFKSVTKNTHATVKPLALMEYLCKLTRTPMGGVVLDPFMGSGTTGMACVNTDRYFVGIELKEGYYEIAQKRIEATKKLQIRMPI